MTVSELARHRGVDKAAISRRVARLVDLERLATRPGPRGAKLINVAEFDKATGETTDAIRELNGLAAKDAPPLLKPDDLVLSQQQARRAAYDADLKKLDLDERLGKLLPIEDVEAAMALCAEALVRKIDQLPTLADEMASAVGRDGAQGARTYFRTIARDLRTSLAAEMRRISETPQRPADAV
jgi:DNA-binding MarR family transcriptional regulator